MKNYGGMGIKKEEICQFLERLGKNERIIIEFLMENAKHLLKHVWYTLLIVTILSTSAVTIYFSKELSL